MVICQKESVYDVEFDVSGDKFYIYQDDVVKELERLGYKATDFTGGNFTHLVGTSFGNYWFVNGITGLLRSVKTTTLAELRSM